ncbi:MAG: sodium:proton exchanger [Micrococcales bacterium]
MTHETLKQGQAFVWRLISPFLLTLLLCAPALTAAAELWTPEPLLGALVYGVAIVSSAFMLGWIGEAAELDLKGGLAIGLLAIVTVLPEYVVSVYFSFAAGSDPSMAQYASANLTGANRLLLGFGWPAVAVLGYLALRRKNNKETNNGGKFGVPIDSEARNDLGFLLYASLIALLIPLTGQMHLLVGVALVVIFGAYLWRQSHADREEPELEGTPAYVGALSKVARRFFIGSIFVLSATIILISAEPFAHDLIAAGGQLGLDQYVLVQWLAPLASEAPEFSLALLFAARGKPALGLAILVSSKVNQWTALTGSLPIAYVVGGGTGASLPMIIGGDMRQVDEFMLTIAQTVLGVALLMGLRLTAKSSILLFGLFAVGFFVTNPEFRFWLSIVYFAIAGVVIWYHRRHLGRILKAPFQLPKKLV